MIHKLIASNKIGSMILFPILLILFQIPTFMGSTGVVGVNFSVFSDIFSRINAQSPVMLLVLKVVVILLSALVLQQLISKLELQRDRGHHALYWYAFLNSFYLSAEVDLSIPIANLFLLLSMSRILSIYRDKKAYSVAFDGGLFLGFSILFNPFYVLLILFLWISLTTLKTLNYREVILVLTGLATPMIVTSFFIYYFDWEVPFFFGQLSWRPQQMFSVMENNMSAVSPMGILSNILTIIVLVMGVIKLMQIANSENTRRSKIFQLLFILTIFMGIIQLLSKLNGMNVPSVIILSVPLSAMMIHFFNFSKKKWVPITLFYIWFALVLANSIYLVV